MIYEIVLKNERLKYYKAIRDLLALFNLFGFTYLLLHTHNEVDKTFYIIFIVVTAIYVLFVLFERFRRKYFHDNIHRIIFLWCAIGWARSSFWWVSILLLVFLFLHILAHQKLIIKFSEKLVELPSIPNKRIEWNELSNVVLKDGLLTMDFKNNKLIQHLIQDSDWDIDEIEFNNFCKEQLNKNELYKYN